MIERWIIKARGLHQPAKIFFDEMEASRRGISMEGRYILRVRLYSDDSSNVSSQLGIQIIRMAQSSENSWRWPSLRRRYARIIETHRVIIVNRQW